MTIYRPALLSAIALLLTGCSYTWDLKTLNRSQATQDLDSLVTNLRAIHPDPFTRISEEAFDAHVRDAKAALPDRIARKDFSLVVAEMLALLRDGHTAHRPYVDAGAYFSMGGRMFPIVTRYENSGLVVAGWYGEVGPASIKGGDAILAIDGKPTEALLQQCRKYISAETEIQQNWTVAFRLSIFLWLTEGPRESYEVTLRRPGGDTYREQVAAYAMPRGTTTATQPGGNNTPTFTFTFSHDGQVCLLKAPTFWYTYREEFTRTVDAAFAQMRDKSTSVLIFDLRGNGGGDGALGMELIHRTIQKPFKSGSMKWRYSKAFQRANLISGLRERGIPAFLHLENVLDLKNYPPYKGKIDPARMKGEYLIYENRTEQPGKPAWKGTLVLLCDRDVYSAATFCATLVKDNKLGIIAGEETGGRASEFTEVAFVHLPNSGLPCMISSAHAIRPAGYDDGRGVLPDLPLDVTLKDDVLVGQICDYLGIK